MAVSDVNNHHILRGITRDTWCGKKVSRKQAHKHCFDGAQQAATWIKIGMKPIPCPDCARAIIKELLKAID